MNSLSSSSTTMMSPQPIINSTVHSNLIPEAYTLNNFEGLFDDDVPSARPRSSVSVIAGASASASASTMASVPEAIATPTPVPALVSVSHQWPNENINAAEGQGPHPSPSPVTMMPTVPGVTAHAHGTSLSQYSYCSIPNIQMTSSALQAAMARAKSYSAANNPSISTSAHARTHARIHAHNSASISQQQELYHHQNVITTPLLSSLFPTEAPTSSSSSTSTSTHSSRCDSLEALLLKKRKGKRSFGTSTGYSTSSTFHPLVSNRKHKKKRTNASQDLDLQENVPMNQSGVLGTNNNKFVYVPVVGSKIPKKDTKEESPAGMFWRLTKSHALSLSPIKSTSPQIKSKYFQHPSPLQKASFGAAIMKAVNTSNLPALRTLLSCGLSPNPCNSFGDSILNTVCRRGDEKVFQCFMECGSSIYTMDSFGRTVLHYLCWANQPSFVCVEYVLERDPLMLITEDVRGKTPLDYVSNSNWGKWKKFLLFNERMILARLYSSLKDEGSSDSVGAGGTTCSTQQRLMSGVSSVSGMTQEKKTERYLPDPLSPLALDVAKELSSGSLSPTDFLKTRAIEVS